MTVCLSQTERSQPLLWLRTRQFWYIYCVVIRFLTSVSSLHCSSSSVWMCWSMCLSISSSCCVCVHFSHQRGTWAGPHVNQSTRGRLFSREIIIVRDVRRWSSLIIFFLPCGTVKRSHSREKNSGDTKADRKDIMGDKTQTPAHVLGCVSDIFHIYLSWGVTSLGGFFRYCLNRSSKAWPMVLMTSWAKPSEHSRIWHAEGEEAQMTNKKAVATCTWIKYAPSWTNISTCRQSSKTGIAELHREHE